MSRKSWEIGVAVVLISIVLIWQSPNIISAIKSSNPNQSPTDLPSNTTNTPIPTLRPANFKISLGDTHGTVTQGNQIQTQVYIQGIDGEPLAVSLNGDSGSSGIKCSFLPSSRVPDFSSILTMQVSASTPTNIYQVTVSASDGEITHTVTYTVSVLSAEVHVSGTFSGILVNSNGYSNFQNIVFVDKATGAQYSGIMYGTYRSSYSITLENGHTYEVRGNNSDGTTRYGLGEIYVYAAAGQDIMTKDFLM
ncbi:MAG: hypothetical protein ACM3UY_00785 [Methanocella sp.]